MGSNVADILHCEKQLRTTLHSDDKEKLRKKLALLQREYLRTAQRLKRAERSEAVRRHVRSRITQENHQDRPREPEIRSTAGLKSSSVTLNSSDGTASGPTDSGNTRTPQVIKFSLPSEGHCPPTTDPCYDAARGHRPSPALSLRSRRSRQRWERRSTESGMSTDNTDEGWEQREGTEADGKQGSEGRVEQEGTEFVNESVELFSDPESESASLLLTHWNTCGQTKRGDMEGKGIQGGQEQSKEEDESTCGNAAIKTEGTENRRREESEGGEEEGETSRQKTSRQKDGKLCEDSRNKNTDQNATKQIESKKSLDLLESCTLVEGLLFPAEYYIRTTRRMTSSQSQPDMQAVVLSQLSAGRPRGRRGRGRASNGNTPSPSGGPQMESDTSAELNSQSQITAFQMETDACSSPVIPTIRPSRGRKRRRGRSRGRPRTPQGSHRLDPDPGQTSDDPRPTSSSVSSSPSLHQTPGHRLYPVFQKSCDRTNSAETCPSPPPAPTSPLPLFSLAIGPLLKNLMNFDVPQDFHLPDDQFASLKLQKLRRVALESRVELFASPSYNTRRSLRRYGTFCDPVMSPLPLSPTTTISRSANSTEAKRAASPSAGLQDVVMKHELTGKSSSQQTDDLHPERHASTETPSLTHDCVSAAGPGPGPGLVDPVEDQRSSEQRPEDKAVLETLSSDRLPGPEDPFSAEGPGEPPLHQSKDSCLPLLRGHAHFLLSPHLCSSAPPSNPILPTLGLTPHPGSAAAPLLTSSPSAPALTLPLPHSPSTQDLSPPSLSPCPSLPSLPPSQPPASPTGQIQASFEPSQRVEPATRPTASRIQSQSSGWGGQGGRDGHAVRDTATLKTPAGGCLVDACCLPGSSEGGSYVAAAGKRTVCLWSQTSASGWSLTHSWTFNEPVINVFPVPDAADLICVTLGQLEIREVRMLSCSSFSQGLLYGGPVQAVVGLPRSRVVTSSHSASGSTLQVFTLLDSGSTLSSQPLTSPGVCVGDLAPVEGIPDALIGTDADGCLFVWNVRTGQLLQRIVFPDSLSRVVCLRGYSCCGVLFVLLQHRLLCSQGGGENEATEKDPMFLVEDKSAERKTTALLSLIAVNPLNGKSIPASRLYPPESWSERLCKADANSCSVVGLSHSGRVCVWELGGRGVSTVVRDPEGEGWQLARWGGRDMLLTGHHNGDVTLHRYSSSVTSAGLF